MGGNILKSKALCYFVYYYENYENRFFSSSLMYFCYTYIQILNDIVERQTDGPH